MKSNKKNARTVSSYLISLIVRPAIICGAQTCDSSSKMGQRRSTSGLVTALFCPTRQPCRLPPPRLSHRAVRRTEEDKRVPARSAQGAVHSAYAVGDEASQRGRTYRQPMLGSPTRAARSCAVTKPASSRSVRCVSLDRFGHDLSSALDHQAPYRLPAGGRMLPIPCLIRCLGGSRCRSPHPASTRAAAAPSARTPKARSASLVSSAQ